MNFKGVIIEESLSDTSVLNDVEILSTKVEPVTDEHKTPWIKQWTLHDVEVSEERAVEVAEKISGALNHEHDWYADYKTNTEHYIIYSGKIFHITDRSSKKQYDEAKKYGISIGIPAYQVNFSLETQIEIAKQLPKTKMLDFRPLEALLDEVMRMLNVMLSKASA
ncbi:MAG: hypothetical protein V1711_00540 [bacterium]